MPSWLKNLAQKVAHAVVPAAGAAAAVAVGLFTGGGVTLATAGKAALGAFIGYMVKPARPAPGSDAP